VSCEKHLRAKTLGIIARARTLVGELWQVYGALSDAESALFGSCAATKQANSPAPREKDDLEGNPLTLLLDMTYEVLERGFEVLEGLQVQAGHLKDGIGI
jgi:hypothetical protein